MLLFGLLAGMSVTNAGIQKKKKNHGSGITLLIFSNEGMIYLMKIVKPLENWRLAVSILQNALTGKGVIRAGQNL